MQNQRWWSKSTVSITAQQTQEHVFFCIIDIPIMQKKLPCCHIPFPANSPLTSPRPYLPTNGLRLWLQETGHQISPNTDSLKQPENRALHITNPCCQRTTSHFFKDYKLSFRQVIVNVICAAVRIAFSVFTFLFSVVL